MAHVGLFCWFAGASSPSANNSLLERIKRGSRAGRTEW